jgi:pimeloyl-ACP methyl ester carboxylesterase
MTRFTLQALTTIAVVFATTFCSDAQREAGSVEQQVSYRTVMVEGISIFYREAGPKSAPTILLLHGLPSSSRMFQPLLKRLADNYHLVAPDYPGFGHSDWPDPKQFAYTFDHIAQLMSGFTHTLGLSHYALYMQDYGGPVGFRMALAHPERIDALIVQDAVAITMALARTGRHAGHSGSTDPPMKKRCVTICCRLLLRRHATSATTRTLSSMIRICGPTSMHF